MYQADFCSKMILYLQTWSSPGPDESSPNELTIHHHEASVGSGIDSSHVIFTSHNGDVNILNAKTGERKLQSRLDVQTRSRPCAFDVQNDEMGNREALNCCCLVSSRNGTMFLLNFSEPSGSIYKLFEYGNDGAESFSSPVLSPNYSLLFLGSRDNRVHVAKLI